MGGKSQFLSRLTCDVDGWALQVNEEKPYPHLEHVMGYTDLHSLVITGDVRISFAGIVHTGINFILDIFFSLPYLT